MAGGIKQWPEDERPREKLLKSGPEALTDAELLALILRTGDAVSGKSALDIGRELLQEFGGLRSLSGASTADICRIKGAGPAKAACVKAALELAGRSGARRLESSERYTSPRQIFDHFHAAYRDRRKEYFLALLLDGKNRIMKEVRISEGSLRHPIELNSHFKTYSYHSIVFNIPPKIPPKDFL